MPQEQLPLFKKKTFGKVIQRQNLNSEELKIKHISPQEDVLPEIPFVDQDAETIKSAISRSNYTQIIYLGILEKVLIPYFQQQDTLRRKV